MEDRVVRMVTRSFGGGSDPMAEQHIRLVWWLHLKIHIP